MKSHWKNRPACSTHFAWKPEDSVSKRFRSLHLLERERYFSTHFCNHWPDETLLSWPLPFTPSISPANRYTEESLLFLASCNESEGNGEAPSHRSPGLLHKRDNEEHQTSAAEVRPHPSEIPIHQSHVLNPIDEYGKHRIKQILFAGVRRPRRQGWIYLPSYQVLQRSLPLDDLFLYKLPWHTKWLKHPARNISMT